jgi:hypothetical protein
VAGGYPLKGNELSSHLTRGGDVTAHRGTDREVPINMLGTVVQSRSAKVVGVRPTLTSASTATTTGGSYPPDARHSFSSIRYHLLHAVDQGAQG